MIAEQEVPVTVDTRWVDEGGSEIRVAVVAPALAVRAGLRALLGAVDRVNVTGEAPSLAELSSTLDRTDILVVAAEANAAADFLDAISADVYPAVLLLVSGEIQTPSRVWELPGRAWGILPLEASSEELAAAINALAEGLFAGSPGLARQLFVRETREQRVEAEPLIEPLTEREVEVLQLLAQGLANKQIAGALGISEHTVKFHTSAIYAKLDAASRTEAVRLGIQKGLIVL